MTAGEWEASGDPEMMLEILRGKASARKLQLFACACCQRLSGMIRGGTTRSGLKWAWTAADGGLTDCERDMVRSLVRRAIGVVRKDGWSAVHATKDRTALLERKTRDAFGR